MYSFSLYLFILSPNKISSLSAAKIGHKGNHYMLGAGAVT